MDEERQSYHMTPDELRRHGREVLEWIARYQERIEELPVLSRVAPGEVRAALPVSAPEEPEPFADVLADLERVILPGLTHWQSPSFFGYFPANASGPAILGELLAAGLGVQGMLWATSPACTELETHVLDWLVELLGLPEAFRSDGPGGGVIQDSASSAALCALLAARDRATGWETNRTGLAGHPPLVAYTSTQAHSSIEKAAMIAGLGREGLRMVEVDGEFAMRPDLLAAAIAADREAGRRPCFVSAPVGTPSSTAVDPVRAIGEIARRE
ncbi:MAG TPA: pyridoxal-dependent decarboxylase, partial [Thermoanaerobaculia bacterium]|nr:pyridoxal-dependent decarboxylase [Thermoanaerobaculia bacterium]